MAKKFIVELVLGKFLPSLSLQESVRFLVPNNVTQAKDRLEEQKRIAEELLG